MTTTVHCPKCQQENPLSALFCGSCGQSLTTKCKLCGGDNSLETKFCRHCGNELGVAKPGLSYDRAMAWRDIFRGINSAWLQWSRFDKDDWAFLQSQNFPIDPDDKLEPWIFGCRIELKDYKPEDVVVLSQATKKGFLGIESHPSEAQFPSLSRALLITTRCQFGLFDRRRKIAFAWPYTDFQKYEIREGTTTVNAYVSDKILRVRFRVPSAGLVDFAMMHSNDPVVRGATVMKAQTKHANRATFMEVIDRFFSDIIINK